MWLAIAPFPIFPIRIMHVSEPIVCKPTPWFTLRAAAMLVMFSVFSVLFYIDGTTGYRQKNLEFYIHATFEKAAADFKNQKSKGELTPESWKEFASKQTVNLPSDPALIPVDTKTPMPWPKVLTEYERMKPGQPHLLWQEYSGEMRMSDQVKEKPFDAGKIREQIIVLYVCLTLVVITLFFLIRTMLRSLSADASALTTASGKVIPYEDMKTLDLRKWDTKGIAIIDYDGSCGRGRARIDGLTYGGFKKENGEPAERLMGMIRENFSGEIIEYASVEPETDIPQASAEAQEEKPKNLR
jgi:hypothetical protein